MPDNLEAFAQMIARAQADVEQKNASRVAAQAVENKIAARISAMTAERTAIVARRAQGDTRPDDGGSLALLAADLEGVQALQPDAKAAASAASAAYQNAEATLTTAQSAFSTEESRLALVAFDDHADRLLELLRQTLDQRRNVANALPPGQQIFSTTIGRLQAFDGLLVSEMLPLRSEMFVAIQYSQQPTWKPSNSLFERVWRLHHNAGRFQ